MEPPTPGGGAPNPQPLRPTPRPAAASAPPEAAPPGYLRAFASLVWQSVPDPAAARLRRLAARARPSWRVVAAAAGLSAGGAMAAAAVWMWPETLAAEISVVNAAPGRAVSVLVSSPSDPRAVLEALPPGSGGLPPGGRVALSHRAFGCQRTVEATYEGGGTERRTLADGCAGAVVVLRGPAAAGGQPPAGLPVLAVRNRGREPLAQVFASPPWSGDWGRQRLPAPVAPGSHTVVLLEAGSCRHDVRLVFAGGSVAEVRGLPTCPHAAIEVP